MDKNTDINNNNKAGSNTKFWIHDPYILFQKNKIFELWPDSSSMTREEILNAISKFIIYTTIIGVVLFRDVKLFFTGIISLIVLIITYYILNNKQNDKVKEAFEDIQLYEKFKDSYTTPDTKNPVMNILLPEIQKNPNRAQAAPAYNKAVEKQINDSTKEFIKENFNDQTIDEKLFNDLGDKFEFEQSMRQFYTTANTRVPNNQNDFAKF